jgi:hypothetical protein
MKKCEICNGTGKIELLTSVVDCECMNTRVGGKSDSGGIIRCIRCDCLLSMYEVYGISCIDYIDGYCHDCYEKLQGGVN